jgi:hypothetical protein
MASLDMTHSSDGGVAIPVMIEGTPRKLLLAPATTFSGLFQDVVTELNLRQESLDRVIGYDDKGRRVDHYVVVSNFAVGGMVGSHVRMTSQARRSTPADIAGYLGSDFLKNFDVDFDFASMKLNLFSPDHCKGQVVYWTQDYVELPYSVTYGKRIHVEVTLDGHDIAALLDTSDDNSYLNTKTAGQTYGIDEHSPGIVPLKDAKPDDSAQFGYHFKSLSFNGVTVTNPFVGLEHSDAEAGYERDQGKSTSAVYGDQLDVVPLSIGYNILGKLHIYIAYGEQKIYLTAANAGAASVQPTQTR